MIIARVRFITENAGYTFVELLGVSAIILILSLLGFQVYDGALDRVRLAKSQGELRTIESALERYRVDRASYPSNLGELVRAGYLQGSATFESPWSKPEQRIYYFYAVDTGQKNKALAFALGDPGPNCSKAASGQKAVLRAAAAEPLPCGRSPNSKAWSFHVEPDLVLEGGTFDMVKGHASLHEFRSSCRHTRRARTAKSRECDLRAES